MLDEYSDVIDNYTDPSSVSGYTDFSNYTDYSDYADVSNDVADLASNLEGLGDIGAAVAAIIGVLAAVWFVLLIVSLVLIIIPRWKMFSKGSIGGWESLIPVHNLIAEMQLGGIQTYFYFLILIPFFGPIILSFWKNIALSKAFGKGTGFGILMTLFPFICYPILGYGKSQYIGKNN